MSKDTEKAIVGLSGVGLGLDELVRQGARQVIQQAIEAELAELLERFANVKTFSEYYPRSAWLRQQYRDGHETGRLDDASPAVSLQRSKEGKRECSGLIRRSAPARTRPRQSTGCCTVTFVKKARISRFWKSTSGCVCPAAEKCPEGQRGSIDSYCAPLM
jgi:hypothetical protein